MFETLDFIDVETLCRELKTSEASVRRDLGALESQRLLKRVYGGAIPIQAPGEYAVESAKLSEEKDHIARLATNLIEDGQTVIIDGGTTATAVARALAGKRIHVITNSLPIAEVLESDREIELTLTGGYLDPRIRVMLGPFCEQMLGAIRADVVIMGMGGITEAGFSNNNTLVVGSEKKMIEVADKLIVVADHTKFGRGAIFPVAPLDAADIVVTDAVLGQEYIDLLRRHSIDVRLA
ncbi:MAG: DeoR/GlpR family DNA-binding transcription regulator [Terracidiphilus sp.]